MAAPPVFLKVLQMFIFEKQLLPVFSHKKIDIENNIEDKPIANDKPGDECFRIFYGQKKVSSMSFISFYEK